MKKLWMMGLASLMTLGMAWAQDSPERQPSGSGSSTVAPAPPKEEAVAQPSSSDSGSTAASADKQGAQASTSGSIAAAQETNVTTKNKETKAAASGTSSSSASASASKKGASADVANGSTMKAELTRPVDVKKNKVGDQVVARTTEDVKSDGKVVIPRGSKLVGHVTQVKQKAKGESESSLGIVFDRAIPKKGPEVPMHAVIQALASGQAQAAATMDDMGAMGSGSGMVMGQADAGGAMMRPAAGSAGGGLVGGVGSTVNSAAGVAPSTVGNVGSTAGGAVGSTAGGAVGSTVDAGVGAAGSAAGVSSAGQLTSASTGVIGLQGLNLSSAAGNSTQGSLITCAERDVRLESGTQMLLRVGSE